MPEAGDHGSSGTFGQLNNFMCNTENKFHFEKKLDFNHILTTISVIIAVVVLYYQAQSTALARKDLDTKVKDLQALSESLERESLARQELEVKQLTELTSQINSSNKLAEFQNTSIAGLGVNQAHQEQFTSMSITTLILLMKNRDAIPRACPVMGNEDRERGSG